MARGESLIQICKDDHLPAASTVVGWSQNESIQGFGEQYARARSLLLEYWAEEIVSISDDGSNDYVEREVRGGRTETIADTDHIQRSKLRVDSRKWLLSKLMPKTYGDRTALEHAGPDGKPLDFTVRFVKPPQAE